MTAALVYPPYARFTRYPVGNLRNYGTSCPLSNCVTTHGMYCTFQELRFDIYHAFPLTTSSLQRRGCYKAFRFLTCITIHFPHLYA